MTASLTMFTTGCPSGSCDASGREISTELANTRADTVERRIETLRSTHLGGGGVVDLGDLPEMITQSVNTQMELLDGDADATRSAVEPLRSLYEGRVENFEADRDALLDSSLSGLEDAVTDLRGQVMALEGDDDCDGSEIDRGGYLGLEERLSQLTEEADQLRLSRVTDVPPFDLLVQQAIDAWLAANPPEDEVEDDPQPPEEEDLPPSVRPVIGYLSMRMICWQGEVRAFQGVRLVPQFEDDCLSIQEADGPDALLDDPTICQLQPLDREQEEELRREARREARRELWDFVSDPSRDEEARRVLDLDEDEWNPRAVNQRVDARSDRILYLGDDSLTVADEVRETLERQIDGACESQKDLHDS
jgi:hypothetical protein